MCSLAVSWFPCVLFSFRRLFMSVLLSSCRCFLLCAIPSRRLVMSVLLLSCRCFRVLLTCCRHLAMNSNAISAWRDFTVSSFSAGAAFFQCEEIAPPTWLFLFFLLLPFLLPVIDTGSATVRRRNRSKASGQRFSK